MEIYFLTGPGAFSDNSVLRDYLYKYQVVLIGYLFAVNTFQPQIFLINYIEFRGNLFMVCNAVWVKTADKPEYLVGYYNLSFLYYLVIFDHDKGS
jgi:hypothetical protein